jgi:hypothetical protein
MCFLIIMSFAFCLHYFATFVPCAQIIEWTQQTMPQIDRPCQTIPVVSNIPQLASNFPLHHRYGLRASCSSSNLWIVAWWATLIFLIQHMVQQQCGLPFRQEIQVHNQPFFQPHNLLCIGTITWTLSGILLVQFKPIHLQIPFQVQILVHHCKVPIRYLQYLWTWSLMLNIVFRT